MHMPGDYSNQVALSADTKKCPFCAEAIQVDAVVCRRCGRDLHAAASAKATGNWPWTIIVLVAVSFGNIALSTLPDKTATGIGSASWGLGPNEPCTVDGPPSGRAAAENWCKDGVFTKVNVSNDESNFVVLLQLSNRGHRFWSANSAPLMKTLEGLTNDVAVKGRMNVAFSLRDPTGLKVGGCGRRRTAREATCESR
jgi:hypothetical protein